MKVIYALPEDKDKVKAELLNINRYVPRTSAEAIKNLEQQRADKKDSAKTAKESKEGVKKTGETAKVDVSKATPENKERCAKYKQDLEGMTTKGNRVNVQEPNGEVRKLTDEEVAKKITETQNSIKIYCQ